MHVDFFYTHNNISSFGPLHTVLFGPIDNLLLFHGDLNIDLLSESLMLSPETGVAEIVVLFENKS